jgi:preprotein translocase subunit SecA
MLQKFVKVFGGDPNKREIEKTTYIVDQINALEKEFEALSDEALHAKTEAFRQRLAEEIEGIQDDDERRQVEQATLDELLPEAFAIVREAAKRTIGQRPYDVQLIGGVVLHQGKIAEMRTGEGKTLVATLPLYLNALTGRGVHLVTVNDYLARRDARWMGAIYGFLGLSVGILQMAASTENGKKAFLYDPTRTSPREDQNEMRLVDRIEAYQADITYGTNSEFGFDYLRDNMVMRAEDKVQRGHYYAIVDEVDNVLIDEARTPLIISGPASGDVEWYAKMAVLVRQLKSEDYEVSEKDHSISLTEIGTAHVEQLLGQPLRDPDRPEDVTPEQAHLLGFLEQALRAQHLYKRNKDYLVQGGKVTIVDEFTGRLMPGRRWSDGLHQAVEAKEGVKVEPENVTYATITLQNYFRMYKKLAGMTGTALTEAEEFDKIYKLAVLPVPTNLEYQAFGQDAPLVEIKAKDEDGFDYSYFARSDDPERQIYLWRRKDYPDVIFRTAEAKLRSIVRDIVHYHVQGRPMLVGTTSVEGSERLSNRLRSEPIRRLLQILLIRNIWLEKNNRFEDGRLIPELQPLNKPIEQLRPEDLRPMAKELGLSLNPEDSANLVRLLDILKLEEADTGRLKTVLQAGVPHQVLNARKHTEESMIIAGAGAFGAVTIATNMAGRGVDIKLGGDLAEEILSGVNRILRKAGYKDPYDMPLQERREALQKVAPSLYGIYETEAKYFLNFFEEMERVRELGGLHIIGSERHEARRIDNQLRGRSARQGDPGSSRFYLSLEDELMRMFGGDQVKGVMERFSIDDDYPLQARLVSNMIEQSQHRVEGANFDIRKHTLEYDDVLNAQRQRIYSQRDRVFEKEDLVEDVNELLSQEVKRRVKEANETEEYWRLLAWLEQVQPPFNSPDGIFPSFTYKLLLDELNTSTELSAGTLTKLSAGTSTTQSPSASGEDLKTALLDLASRTIRADQDHFLAATLDQIDHAGLDLQNQIDDRIDSLDTALDGLTDNLETETRRPNVILEELSGLVRVPFRLDSSRLPQLVNDPKDLASEMRAQAEAYVTNTTIIRLANTIEFRLGESLGLNPVDLQDLEWSDVAAQIEEHVHQALAERQEKLLGADGQIPRDLESALERLSEYDDQAKLRLLGLMAQGTSTFFDARTHRQVRQVFTRLHYIYLAGETLRNSTSQALEEEVLEHLQEAQQAQRHAWGESERVRLGENAPSIPLEELGHGIQTQIYRQVLLGAITELWVDYLTRVEALRVSVGLEAYAQADPLVKYKSQASEMFQGLLSDIRSGVIGRIFLYQPRAVVAQAEPGARSGRSPASANTSGTGDQPGDVRGTKIVEGSGITISTSGSTKADQVQNPSRKRKRHRH